MNQDVLAFPLSAVVMTLHIEMDAQHNLVLTLIDSASSIPDVYFLQCLGVSTYYAHIPPNKESYIVGDVLVTQAQEKKAEALRRLNMTKSSANWLIEMDGNLHLIVLCDDLQWHKTKTESL